MQPKDEWLDKVVCKNYRILSPINKGSFGVIYLAIHQLKQEYFAVKILNTGRDPLLAKSVRAEAQLLYKLNGTKGFPRLYYFVQDQHYSFIVQTLLGKNLQQLLSETTDHRFSLKTVLLFMEKATDRLQYLHGLGYLHRDIKPENFMTGLEDEELYLIDFGFAQQYMIDGVHIERSRTDKVIGTPRFCPICVHNNTSQCRASDFESLGYLAVFLLKGHLPWMNLHTAVKEEKLQLIGQKKSSTSVEQLCSGLPKAFEEYFRYVGNITFESEPNYQFIRELFRKLYHSMGFALDNRYDWSKGGVSGSQDDLMRDRQRLFLTVGRKSVTADVCDETPQQLTRRKIEQIHKCNTSEFFYVTDLEPEEIAEFEDGISLFDRMQQLHKKAY